MALTFTQKLYSVFGNARVVIYDVDFDSVYPDGGEAVTASNLGLSEILYLSVIPRDEASGRLIYNWDTTNGKIQVLFPTGGTAPATITDPAFTTTSGATTVTGSAAVSAAITEVGGRGIELAASTDASTVLVRVFAIGK